MYFCEQLFHLIRRNISVDCDRPEKGHMSLQKVFEIFDVSYYIRLCKVDLSPFHINFSL